MSSLPTSERLISIIRTVLNSQRTWWQDTSLFKKSVTAFLTLFYLLSHELLGGIESNHIIYSIGIGILFYTGPFGHHLLRFLLPLVLVAMVYDAQHYYAPLLRAPIRIQEPYELEIALFGIGESTPAQWFQSRTHPFLDVITGVTYIGFVHVYLLMAGYFYFFLPYRTRGSRDEARYRCLGQCMMLGFLIVALVGYITYLIYPAAPPWYVDRYGFELVIDAPPEAAGAARFDAIVGFPISEVFYSKNTNVFGAIPSLHCGQLFLAFYFTLLAGKLRFISGLFLVIVLFGSVYLNHHYVIDALAGVLYALVVGVAIAKFSKLKSLTT